MGACVTEKPNRYIAKIPNTRGGRRALEAIRKYLNRDQVKLRVLFGGPRPRGGQSGRMTTATHFRVYFDSHEFAEVRRQYYEIKNLYTTQSRLLTHAEESLALCRERLAFCSSELNEPNPWIHFARFWRTLVASIKRSVP